LKWDSHADDERSIGQPLGQRPHPREQRGSIQLRSPQSRPFSEPFLDDRCNLGIRPPRSPLFQVKLIVNKPLKARRKTRYLPSLGVRLGTDGDRHNMFLLT
jgi:hypothetical protein